MAGMILGFGAAFDPPHLGHLRMAREMVERGIAKKVILIPCAKHAFAKNMSLASDRYKMVELMTEQLRSRVGDFFETSMIEMQREGVSYTYDTLRQLAMTYPREQIGWLMGSDQLKNFDQWYKYEEMLKKHRFFVYPRQGYPIQNLLPGMQEVVGAPVIEVSSTRVRQAYLAGESLENMVLPKVSKYIKEHKLWQK